jgi:protein-S-isoprenylcysteine O-methyltransferase Ste14
LTVQTLKVAVVLNIDMNLTQVMLMPLVVLKQNGASEAGWGLLWVVFFGLVAAGIAGYAVYKYRIRVRNKQLVSEFGNYA